jgi:acetyl esterase/lipase
MRASERGGGPAAWPARRRTAIVVGLASLVALAVTLAGLRWWRATPFGTTTLTDLAYVPDGDMQQTLDLYLPRGVTAAPLVIWVHGGGWETGGKADPPVLGMIRHGYAVASIDFRLSSTAKFPAQIQDCKAAVRWLRAHSADFHLDPRRFAGIGASSGGHLVALMATTGRTAGFDVGQHLDASSALDAAVDYFGPTDLIDIDSPMLLRPLTKLFGGPARDNEAAMRRASPLTWVTRSAPPFLIIHSENDRVVPYEQSVRLRDALARAGADVHLHTLKGSEHDNVTVSRTLPDVLDFLDRALRPRGGY